jgi:hypothetical protein
MNKRLVPWQTICEPRKYGKPGAGETEESLSFRNSVGHHTAFSLKTASTGPIRTGDVRNRLPARIFTVDNRPGERTIQNGQVSQLSHSLSPPGSGWDQKETCEESL